VKISAWLNVARRAGLSQLDAQLLVAHALGATRTWVLAHDDQDLGAAALASLEALRSRRAAGEPLAYLVGEREFHGLMLAVTPDVLVPRPETEGLVAWALERVPQLPHASLVDLGTGSGAIALACKHRAPQLEVSASDQSASALAVARRNARRHGLAIDWSCGDWWAPHAGRRFGLAVSNPPYVAAGDPHLAALGFEPAAALVGGADGLSALRRIIAGAPAHLLGGGWLLLEHGHDQAEAVAMLLAATGFEDIECRRDLAGLPRCSGARLRSDALAAPRAARA
jgi:release factor glutamine methyltransferase